MSMSINNKTDYSALLSSVMGGSSDSSSNMGINLADYASIKNGTYGKLLKAYYAKQDSESSESGKSGKKLTEDKVSELQKVASYADSLKTSADKLLAKGSKSLFAEKTTEVKNEDGTTTTKKDYDRDAIYKAASDFVDNYNSFLSKAKKSSESSVSNRADSLANMMTINYKALKSVGIEIKDDDSLTINEDTFKKADMTAIKNVFNGNQSIVYQATAQASMIGTSATTAANSASGYTSSGSYQTAYSAGSMVNDIV